MHRAWLLLAFAGCGSPPPATPLRPVDAIEKLPPSPEEERRMSTSSRWYDLALSHYNRGDFDKAKELARKAVQENPEDLAARKLLDDIHSIIVGTPVRTPHERDVRLAMVGIEQAQIEIAKHLADGRRYRGAGMHASARREYEAAELKIRALPYDVPALRDLLPEIRAALAR